MRLAARSPAGWLQPARAGAVRAGCPARGGCRWCSPSSWSQLVGRLATLPLSIAARRLSLDHGLQHGLVGLLRVGPGEERGRGHRRHLAGAAGAGRLCPPLATGLAGDRRRAARRAWSCSARSSTRSWSSRSSTTSSRCPTATLRTEILALADEEGVEIDDVLVADASRRTTTLNAYVSGFGSTRRVVVYDTLVETLPRGPGAHRGRPRAGARAAPRRGHRDPCSEPPERLLGVGLLGAGARSPGRSAAARRWRSPRWCRWCWRWWRWPRSLTAPVQNGISRQIETRADVDALAGHPRRGGVRRPAAQAGAAVVWPIPTPPAWSQFWFGSHPTALKRMALAERIAGDSVGRELPVRRGPSPPSPEADSLLGS